MDVLLALLASGELDEQVGEAGVAEEPLFRLLTVLVHGVTHYREVYKGSLHHIFDVFFLKMVAQHDRQNGRNELMYLRHGHRCV